MVDFKTSLKEHEYIKPEGLRKVGLDILKVVLRLSTNSAFNAQIAGADLVKDRAGKKTIVVGNHVGYDDAYILGLNIREDMAYAIDTAQYNLLMQIPPASLGNLLSAEWRKKRLIKALLHHVELVPINPTNPMSFRTLSKIVNAGKTLAIFPEGALTKTGTIGITYEGAARIAAATGADVFVANLRGAEFLSSSSRLLKGYPRHPQADIGLTVFPPVKIEPAPEGLSRADAKAHVMDQMDRLLQNAVVEGRDKSLTLSAQFNQSVWNFGADRDIIESYKIIDGVPYPVTTKYGDVLLKSLVLGNHLKRYAKKRENVGLMLPNGDAGAIGFMALHKAGLVPTMLNPSHGSQQLVACTETAQVKTIVTSRQYVEKAKIQGKIDELAKTCRIIYLEDEKDKISAWSKLNGKLRSVIWNRPSNNRWGLAGALAQALNPVRLAGNLLEAMTFKLKAGDPAVVLFSTGSEGAPKAIVHSSQTLLANIEQVRTAFSTLNPDDIIFNPMPIFHSFGMTGGMILPLMKGIKSVQYLSPLDNKGIPDAVYHQTANVLMGTPTFLGNWARYASPKHFMHIKAVITGGEKYDPAKRTEHEKIYGVAIDDCFGATETAPVISANARGTRKPGSVGKLLPGMTARLEPVPGIENGGRLFVKGPNVMLGVMKHEKPGVIVPPADGEHDTGDIVTIDPRGFLAIKGRAKRFAKPGGEMVSLDLIESFAAAASRANPNNNPKKEHEHFALAVPDEKRGERIVMLTTDAELTSEQMQLAAKVARQDANLGMPKSGDIVRVPSMPKLGIKINGQILQKIFAGTARDADLVDSGLNPQDWYGIGDFKPQIGD